MKIGIDLDGVVYPWHEEVYRYFQENSGYSKPIGEFWTKDKWMVTEYHITIPFLYSSTSPRQDVVNYLPLLGELGELFYITARPVEVLIATQKFLDKIQAPFKENLIFSKDKANYARLLRLDYFLDDSPDNVKALEGVTTAYLFKAVHNRYRRDGFNVIGSFKELYEVLKG